MKLGKAIAAAVGTAAAVGAAVYAKRRLDETQTPLKKQRSVTVWKSGGKVQHKEVIRKPVSEGEQTDILKSRIDKATRQYEQLADRNNDTESEPADNTENEQEIAPVNFTFVQSEEDGNTGVSFDRVFDHFNRLEKPIDEENKTVDNADNNIVDTITANQTAVATDDEYEAAAISAVMTMQEEQESEAEQMKLEKGIMTPDPIASAVRELADIQPVTDGVNDVSVERMSVDESIFDLSASEPVEEAVKAFEEITEQAEEQPEIAEETAESASTLEEEFTQAMAENAPVSEPVEEAVKAFEEMSEQAEEQPEIVEETAESASTLEEEFAQAMAENIPVSEPVEEAVKAFEEISEQAEEQPEIAEETAESASTLEEEFTQAMAENIPVSEPVEEAVKAFEEMSEQAEEQPEIAEETAESSSTLEEEFAQAMAENAPVSEPVEEAVKAFEEITEQAEEQPEIAEETAESASTLEEEFAQAMAENVPVNEPVEEAVKAFEEITEQAEEQPEIAEETAESASTLEEEFAQAMAENAPVSEPVEEAVKAFEEISEQAEEQPEIAEETAESASTLEEEFAQAMTENAPVSEPVEEAVKAFEEMSEQAEEQPEIAEETAEAANTLEEEFTQAMAENAPVSEPVEEAVKAFEEISEQAEEQPEIAEETAESASTLEEEFAQAMAENVPVNEPVEEAVKAFEEIAEPVAVEISESQAEDMLFENIDNIDDDLSDDIASVRTAESVDDAVKEFSDLIGEPEAAMSMINADAEYDDDLEQTGDIPAEENSTAEEQLVIQTVPEAQTEKPRTMDFFDLPDEAYAPVQASEKKHDDNVAEVEDLFGDLLADDEPVEKKTFTDPSEVFSMFDTADAGQDDFDKYNDEKIEEENEKKKTSDAKKYIAQDIADNIASFAQLLEPLNAIKENKIRSKSGILFDWEMRIQSLIGDLPIKTYWRNNFRNYEIWTDEKCMEKAGELLAMLELVGIVRDKAKEVVVDKDTLDFYSAQSEHLNNDFHIGETVVVTRPCWRINGKPARKGEIAKKAPFAEFSRKKVSPLETMLRENSCSDGDVNIPVTEDNFCTYDREIPYVKQAIADGFCKCAVRRMEDGGALAFFYEVIAEGENEHYSPCTLRFEVNIDKNAKVVGRFRSEKV